MGKKKKIEIIEMGFNKYIFIVRRDLKGFIPG